MILAPAVEPPHAFYAGPPVHVTFATAKVQDLDVRIIRVRTHRTVHRVVRTAAAAGPHRIRWDGLTPAGLIGGDGRYAVRVNDQRVGTFTFHRYRYPIDGPHADRGGIGYFGAARNGGRIHEGFDVNSPCGTPVVAARGGRVVRSVYDPVLYGNLVQVRGRRTHRVAWYAHLQFGTPRPAVGEHVRTGQRLGRIGDTGNAVSVGCHLHIELHDRGTPIDPAPFLHAWDTWS